MNLFIWLISISSAYAAPVRICTPNNIISAQGFIAKDQHYFEEEGLEPSFVVTTNFKLCLDAMLSNNADFSFGAEGPFLFFADENLPIRIIASHGTNAELGILSVYKNLEEAAKYPVGYLPGTTSEIYLRILEEKIGKNFKTRILQPSAFGPAISGGVVSSMLMWEPWVTNAKEAATRAGIVVQRIKDAPLYLQQGIISERSGFAVEHPEIEKKYLKVLFKASKYIKEHTEESKIIFSRETKLTVPQLNELWSGYDFEMRNPKSVLDVMYQEYNLLRRHVESLKNKPDINFARYIYEESFNAVGN